MIKPLAALIIFVHFTLPSWGQISEPIISRFDYFERRTVNEDFESGLTSWNRLGIAAGVSVQNWSALPDDPNAFYQSNSKFLTQPDDADAPNGFYDGKVVKLSGRVGLWQYAAINGKATRQVACCNARKRLIPGANGTTGWAGFGVIYYDASWVEIDRQEQQIFDVKTNAIEPDVGYSQYSFGLNIPSDAVYSILWISNDGNNTELWADDLILLNMFSGPPRQDLSQPVGSRFTQDPLSTSFLGNASFNGIISFDYVDFNSGFSVSDRFILANSSYFWDSALLSQSARIDRGIMRNASAQWQLIDLVPGETYELRVAYGDYGNQAVVGIDFYDSNWNQIDKVSEPLDANYSGFFPTGGTAFLDKQLFTVPTNAAHSSFFIWNAEGGQISIYQAYITPAMVQSNIASFATVAATAEASPSSQKAAPLGRPSKTTMKKANIATRNAKIIRRPK